MSMDPAENLDAALRTFGDRKVDSAAAKDDIAMSTRLVTQHLRSLLPQLKSKANTLRITREKPVVELVKVTKEMKAFKAYDKLRLERTNKRHLGARQKRAAEAEKK